MAFDGACLHFLLSELEEQLIDTRIEKIYQPAKDEILFVLKGSGGRGGRLAISINASCAGLSLSEKEITNPKEPPGFCMLLRKRLKSALLTQIRQIGLDRIVEFSFDTHNEMGDRVIYRLIVELMGRYSNLILIDETGLIVDSAKHVDVLMSAKRQILPHYAYELPPTKKKLNPLIASPEEMAKAICSVETADLEKAVLSTLEGFSPVVAREILFRAEKACGKAMTEGLTSVLTEIVDDLRSKKGIPHLYLNKDGLPAELSFLELTMFAGYYQAKPIESFSKLLESYYGEKSRGERIRQRAGDLLQWMQGTIGRIEKKLGLQNEELFSCKDREADRICGDLITANIYRLQKGDTSLEAEDYYNNGEIRTIRLDNQLTPAQNAQRYYKKYRKAETAEKTLTEQIRLGKEELEYLLSVQDVLLRAESEDELAEIRLELETTGYLKKHIKSGTKPVATKPRIFCTSDGFTVYVGRNNLQNDKLTLKQSAKTDIWFHTKGIHGSHTVLVAEGKNVPEQSLFEAALLAAYHSKGRTSSQVPVDYCPIANVHKPSGAKPGMVIYDSYKTIYVTPSEEAIEKLRQSKGGH